MFGPALFGLFGTTNHILNISAAFFKIYFTSKKHQKSEFLTVLETLELLWVSRFFLLSILRLFNEKINKKISAGGNNTR